MKRILVVDDEPDACANLSDILNEHGMAVDTACDARRAIALVEQNRYDLVLLDLKMPEMDGLQLYQNLKRIRSDTVAVMVTAFAEPDVTRDAGKLGIWRIVPKPVDTRHLLEVIQQVAHRPVVLVIDDDQSLCASLEDVLQHEAFRVVVVHDVKRLSATLKAHRFDVCLVDLILPEGDGRHAIRLIEQHQPAAKTILITGHQSEQAHQIERALNEGARAVCYKPFDVPQLLDTIRSMIREDGVAKA